MTRLNLVYDSRERVYCDFELQDPNPQVYSSVDSATANIAEYEELDELEEIVIESDPDVGELADINGELYAVPDDMLEEVRDYLSER
ncbi:hypothetical protein KY362_05735, partial [Candidatus Woesearchaeota archaeon]|nr:hypothetical protein [Candidatus Woesearchaeota archaeon]